jgi:hypothetical protein
MDDKLSSALRLYTEGKVTISRAAKIAGMSLWETVDLIDEAVVVELTRLGEEIGRGWKSPQTSTEIVSSQRR